MKFTTASCALLLLAAADSARLSPITRVVELLQGLAIKTEHDGKREEDLFETYVCWGTKVVDEKTASNEAAEKRSSELKEHISDIESGRIEFTSERQDLEKELSGLNAGIEAAEDMREKEKADFEQAAAEMTQAVTALDKAIDVLKEATVTGRKPGALFVQGRQSEGFAQRTADANALEYATSLGEKFLSRGDALFLRRLLGGEVPKRADWKKLNRKATFKMGYKARSSKIQELLASLQETFKASLADAETKERSAQETHDTLMEAKTEQKEAAEEAMQKMGKENGAKAMNKEEAQEEVDALDEQVKSDKKYIEQVQNSLKEKKEEWKDRQVLRAGELEAISKAVSILHSDDARDLFKRSAESQGFLLQVSSSSSRAISAAEVLRKAGLGRLAARLGAGARVGSHFKEVIASIDQMIKDLDAEADADLALKERCEKENAASKRSAIVHARTVDEATDAIARLKEDVAEIEAEVRDNEEAVKETEKATEEARKNRKAEKTAWGLTDADDKAAVKLVKMAHAALDSFYKDNNLMLLQRQREEPSSTAGKAPPPPPSTWEAPYGGQTAQSGGILSILDIISEDIEKDRTKAASEEAEAAAAFEKLEADSKAHIEELQASSVTLGEEKADKEGKIGESKESRTSENKNLAAVMKVLADLKPGCDYIAVNFEVKRKNRHTEADGLRKAKTILEGGTFDAPDPDREMTPGDAL